RQSAGAVRPDRSNDRLGVEQRRLAVQGVLEGALVLVAQTLDRLGAFGRQQVGVNRQGGRQEGDQRQGAEQAVSPGWRPQAPLMALLRAVFTVHSLSFPLPPGLHFLSIVQK